MYNDNNFRKMKRSTNSFKFSKPRFRNNYKKQIKKLDHNLFIQKVNQDTQINTQVVRESIVTKDFSEFNITDKLKRNIKDHGYEIPTEIQEKTIPEIVNGKDIIAMANTGTGKTAAFLISLINKSFLDRSQRTLIVVPTRELAVQIRDEYRIFAKGTELEVVALIGGVDIKKQKHGLNHNPHFVIATPGRLKDLIVRKGIDLSLFQNVVLDEVDKMVDIGFIHDIKFIISFLPKKRQSLFFSATINKKTEEILNSFVTNPVTISAKTQETVNNIDQDIIKLANGETKIDALHNLLTQPEFDKVIIFGRTKWRVQKLTNDLLNRGFKVAAIHGNKTQGQRQRAIQQFKNHEIQILTATDIVSRGLDIDNVSHVINYDAPESYDDYIHRIGRTGRAGKKGIALTFVE